MKAPSEKLIELLFTKHALHICGAQTALYAPSSREEYFNGYDAKFIGRSGCRELYLQFKTPYVRQDGLFTATISNIQHSRLLAYPRSASFYVSHSFSSIQEVQDYQLRVTNPRDFLKYFIVVEAHALSPDTNFFQFARDTEIFPLLPKFKRNAEGNIKKAHNVIRSAHWCSGDSVLQKFKKGKAGCTVKFAESSSPVEFIEAAQCGISLARAMPEYLKFADENEADSNFGIMLRDYG